MNFLKKYWDIIGGFFTGITLSFLVSFNLDRIQLIYSILILVLVSIGVFKVIRQSIEKNIAKKRKETPIDTLVNVQKPVKAVNLAQYPTKEGEELGNLLLELWKGTTKKMKKLKEFFDKFKGFILSLSLMLLSIVEMCGGLINQLFDGKLTINGVEILPIVTLVCAVVVGCLSNSFTKEQWNRIKELFKNNKNDLVIDEIKKQLKEDKVKLTQLHKSKDEKEKELSLLESQLKSANNTLEAKRQMYEMTPRLATREDVESSINGVNELQVKVNTKKSEISSLETEIENLTTIINALQSQL